MRIRIRIRTGKFRSQQRLTLPRSYSYSLFVIPYSIPSRGFSISDIRYSILSIRLYRQSTVKCKYLLKIQREREIEHRLADSSVFNTPGKVAAHEITEYTCPEAGTKTTYHRIALLFYLDKERTAIDIFGI